MLRKMMTKEITKTTLKVAEMKMTNGIPEAIPMPDEIVLGHVRLERAQRIMNKKYPGKAITVFEAIPETILYEMEVERFIEVATPKEETAADVG